MSDAPAVYDVVVIGAGPAGLSAALNLVRARRTVLILDSNRPRNAATLKSHGYLSRDGISPLELRKIGRDELEAYPEATFEKVAVSRVESTGETFTVTAGAKSFEASRVLIATGLTEIMPVLPSLRTFYGTSVHSCMECDAYEYADRPIALIGETDDLAYRATLLSQWSRDLIVFTNGVAEISAPDEAALAARGVTIDRRPVADLAGDRTGLTGITLADGETIARSGAFMRPGYAPKLEYLEALGLETDGDGFLMTAASGRTSLHGVYAAGDSTAPGPQQLIVAAGAGGRVAAAINRDLLGLA